MPRLPRPGKDNDVWGDVLNDYLRVSFHEDGTLRPIEQSVIVDLSTSLSEKLSTSGGQISGNLSVGDGSTSRSVTLTSSYSGGDDDGASEHFDSTSRINLYAYQRAHFRSYGEVNRVYLMRKDAKGMYAYYGPRSLYDTNRDAITTTGFKPWVWVGAHYEANDHNSIHGHWEVEVPDTTGALQGRLEIPFIDQESSSGAIGVNVTNIRTNLADFSVRATNGQVLRVGAGNSHNKDILLSASSDRATSGRRWALRANNETESGSNSGTNFQIIRYGDDGSFLGSALSVRRSDGNASFGASGASSARITAVWNTSGNHGFYALPSSTIGSASAFNAELVSSAERAYQARVSGDANARFVCYADGKFEFGDGTNTRDTTLYRSSADLLRTDDSFHVGANLRVNTFSTGGGSGVLGIGEATSIPTLNPTGGGVLYVENGALKYKGPAGTVTTIAAS